MLKLEHASVNFFLFHPVQPSDITKRLKKHFNIEVIKMLLLLCVWISHLKLFTHNINIVHNVFSVCGLQQKKKKKRNWLRLYCKMVNLPF